MLVDVFLDWGASRVPLWYVFQCKWRLMKNGILRRSNWEIRQAESVVTMRIRSSRAGNRPPILYRTWDSVYKCILPLMCYVKGKKVLFSLCNLRVSGIKSSAESASPHLPKRPSEGNRR